ncbi:hypothetical protein ACFPVX_13950 [Cohnella faecalis]|uniref:DoxX family membrane protein n=1 Tax=Cohnella faecalis TaxID=2315694 RepID=A0A398CJV5_9BACL|nr:hypothetical protein [Cohnella faecalis]RIE02983.1 hypothetical protein D3H35_20490 [Cohnella faecalis]
MRIVYHASRLLLGIIFITGAVNAVWIHVLGHASFMPLNEKATNLILETHYLYTLVKIFETAGAMLLLLNKYVGLGALILSPVVGNILFMHIVWDPGFVPVALLMVVAEAILIWKFRSRYRVLFER